MIRSKYECPYFFSWLRRMTLIEVKCHEPTPVRKSIMLHNTLQNLEFVQHCKKRDTQKQREIDNEKIVYLNIVVKCSHVQNEQKTFALVRENFPSCGIVFFGASPLQATCHNSLSKLRFSTYMTTWKKQNKAKKQKPKTPNQQPSIHHLCMK